MRKGILEDFFQLMGDSLLTGDFLPALKNWSGFLMLRGVKALLHCPSVDNFQLRC
jgi:hypothetical protein